MSVPILTDADLQDIFNQVGPNDSEGQVEIWRTSAAPARSGSGFTKPALSMVYRGGARVSPFYGQRTKDVQIAGEVGAEAHYVIEMAPRVNVQKGDEARWSAPIWLANQGYSQTGAWAVPTAQPGYRFQVVTPGISGPTEPSWPATTGDMIADGTVTWQNVGAYPILEVVDVETPVTYQVIMNVYCLLRS